METPEGLTALYQRMVRQFKHGAKTLWAAVLSPSPVGAYAFLPPVFLGFGGGHSSEVLGDMELMIPDLPRLAWAERAESVKPRRWQEACT